MQLSIFEHFSLCSRDHLQPVGSADRVTAWMPSQHYLAAIEAIHQIHYFLPVSSPPSTLVKLHQHPRKLQHISMLQGGKAFADALFAQCSSLHCSARMTALLPLCEFPGHGIVCPRRSHAR